jgi:hypothetical protein
LLAKQVDGGSLALFRIGVGLVMALEAYSLCRPYVGALSNGKSPLELYYAGPDITFHFPYSPFAWLPVLPERAMYLLAGLQALAGITLALGLWYRLSILTVFLSWGYFFVIESTRSYWQSHYYLELLVCFLMVWLPESRRYSLAEYFSRNKSPRTVPFWPIFLLRGQLVIAYFYAGVAKINLDWLLDAVPVRWFLAERNVTAPYEHLMSPSAYESFQRFIHNTTFAYFLSYTGLIFDLAVGFLFLFRRTRIFAMIVMVCFHATNHFLIFRDIGWFPLVGVATSLIFLDPDWPERFWRWLRQPRFARPDWKWFWAGAVVFPVVGGALGWRLRPSTSAARTSRGSKAPSDGSIGLGPLVTPLVLGWLVFQALVPLRHYAIRGDSRFTYEGLSFSWRLKSEVHSAHAVELHVHDDVILPRDATNGARIQWDQWHGDRVVYDLVNPKNLNLGQLPEFAVILDPLSGERIVYNPYSSQAAHTETQARQRINEIWQKRYGHVPKSVTKTTPVSQILSSLSDGLRAGNNYGEADTLAALVPPARKLEQGKLSSAEASTVRESIFSPLEILHARDAFGEVTALLRTVDPFALADQTTSTCLLIEDPLLCEGSLPSWPVLNRRLLIGSAAASSSTNGYAPLGGDYLTVYVSGDLGEAAKFLLPQESIFKVRGEAGQTYYIFWNTLKDASSSKANHISNQAFYLRRYARRVAALWEKEYARRPAVTAITGVSLNGRPFEPLVKPDTDLASVGLSWFTHNWWIEDSKTPRVPREVLNHDSGWFVEQ